MSGSELDRLGFRSRVFVALGGMAWILGMPIALILRFYDRAPADQLIFCAIVSVILSAMGLVAALEGVNWILKGRAIDAQKVLSAGDTTARGGELSEFRKE